MKKVVCVGVNHRRAPVEVRERVAFSNAALPDALDKLRSLDGIDEAVILSTCNRVEVYVAGDADLAPFQVGAFLHEHHGFKDGDLDDFLFRLVGEDAVKHLFRVAASLEAIVVGEPQILGQVKDAFFNAVGHEAVGAQLSRTFHKTFNVAKRVRTDTDIASSAVSVSYAGVELAKKIFGDLRGLRCVLVGAGEMAELAARHFVDAGAELIICNRSIERAHALAEQYGGVARELAELPRLLVEADVMLTSTSAPGFVITKDLVAPVHKKRRYRPLLLVDIAVPRDVDPRVAELDATYVYDVDDLAQVVEDNLDRRRDEAEKAEQIVTVELLKFAKGNRERNAVPTIRALRSHFEALAKAEIDRALGTLDDDASDKQKKAIQKLGNGLINKLLHHPMVQLKQKSADADPRAQELYAAIETLFDLELSDDEVTDIEAVRRAAEEAQSALDDDLDDERAAG